MGPLGIDQLRDVVPLTDTTSPRFNIDKVDYHTTGSGYLPADDCGETLSGGDADVTIEIPNVTPGEKRLDVYAGGLDEDASIVIGGSSVLATPTTVLPNQRVTLTGSGFSRNSVITNITLGGDEVDLKKLKDDDKEIDSGGSWAFAINIPVTRGTADAGDLVLLVEDRDERTGSTTLTIAEPTVTFTPEEGLVGSTITITGENFPGMNGEDGARDVDVEIEYLVSGTKRGRRLGGTGRQRTVAGHSGGSQRSHHPVHQRGAGQVEGVRKPSRR